MIPVHICDGSAEPNVSRDALCHACTAGVPRSTEGEPSEDYAVKCIRCGVWHSGLAPDDTQTLLCEDCVRTAAASAASKAKYLAPPTALGEDVTALRELCDQAAVALQNLGHESSRRYGNLYDMLCAAARGGTMQRSGQAHEDSARLDALERWTQERDETCISFGDLDDGEVGFTVVDNTRLADFGHGKTLRAAIDAAMGSAERSDASTPRPPSPASAPGVEVTDDDVREAKYYLQEYGIGCASRILRRVLEDFVRRHGAVRDVATQPTGTTISHGGVAPHYLPVMHVFGEPCPECDAAQSEADDSAHCIVCGELMGDESSAYEDETVCKRCEAKEASPRPPSPAPAPGVELIGRITEYLSTGGLFNPEMMDHGKVRDLLIDCRSTLSGLHDDGGGA